MSFQRSNGHTGNTMGGKLDSFLDQRELPMYKDKPYSYSASRRIRPLYRQWRVSVGAVLLLLIVVYYLGFFSFGGTGDQSGQTAKSKWGWTGKTASSVDWDSRREKVKEAFILSWDGYEQYAWGMLNLRRTCYNQAGTAHLHKGRIIFNINN